MTRTLVEVIGAVEDLLRAETAAIEAGDLRGATALAGRKTDAIETLVGLGQASPDAAARHPGSREAVDRLRAAIAANAAALERALVLQGRVIEAVARAAVREGAASAPGYAAAPRRTGTPLAISVRA